MKLIFKTNENLILSEYWKEGNEYIYKKVEKTVISITFYKSFDDFYDFCLFEDILEVFEIEDLENNGNSTSHFLIKRIIPKDEWKFSNYKIDNGLLVEHVLDENSTIKYYYDNNRNLIKVKKGDLDLETYTYNEKNLLIKVKSYDGFEDIIFIYDENDKLVKTIINGKNSERFYNKKGLLIKIVDNSYDVEIINEFIYDENDKLLIEKVNGCDEFVYEYDGKNLIRDCFINGYYNCDYTYNENNELINVKNNDFELEIKNNIT